MEDNYPPGFDPDFLDGGIEDDQLDIDELDEDIFEDEEPLEELNETL